MAKAKLQFRPFDYDALPNSIKEQLAIIDAAKAIINATLAESAGEGWKAQHSYKLDFAAGKRVFKAAFYRAAQAKPVAQPIPAGNLHDWVKAQLDSGHKV